MTHRFQMNRIKQEKEAMHQHIRATDKTKDHLSDSGWGGGRSWHSWIGGNVSCLPKICCYLIKNRARTRVLPFIHLELNCTVSMPKKEMCTLSTFVSHTHFSGEGSKGPATHLRSAIHSGIHSYEAWPHPPWFRVSPLDGYPIILGMFPCSLLMSPPTSGERSQLFMLRR